MAEPRPWPKQPDYAKLIGYSEPWSVAPGDRVTFMVSSDHPRYRAGIVRLQHGDDRPGAPGLKEEPVASSIDGEYEGRPLPYPAGSFVAVPDAPALRPDSFTLAAWIFPTMPTRAEQGLLTKWSQHDSAGYGLVIDQAGALALQLSSHGATERISVGAPLRAGYWYFVAASFDATAGIVRLVQRPYPRWPLDASDVAHEERLHQPALTHCAAPVLMGAWSLGVGDPRATAGHYDGKIESPVLLKTALDLAGLEALASGPAKPGDAIAAWDFSLDSQTDRVRDTVAGVDGTLVNRPARAMTGHAFAGGERAWPLAPETHGALYFHHDDLEDCRWPAAFKFTVPDSMGSGVYAAKLTAGTDSYHIPFYVRPTGRRAKSPILFLAPTNSYLAYANFRETFATDKLALGLYHQHADGSAVFYSSRRRPIVNHRPGSTFNILGEAGGPGAPHQFNADLYLVDWLTEKGFQFDVAIDEDLQREGTELLSQYKVIVTGSHPEYWSGEMMDSLQAFLADGGRLMYLGGNGLIWVTTFDTASGHYVEVRRGGGGVRSATAGERYHSTTGEYGGYWLERGRPPQQTVGVGSIAQGFDLSAAYERQPESEDPRTAWIFEGVADGPIGNFGLSMGGAAGFEVDKADFERGTPPHTILLATAATFSPTYEHQNPVHVPGTDIDLSKPMSSDMVFFETPNGGAVFSVGSIAYLGALSHNSYENNVSRITENVLRRFASPEPIGPKPTS